MSDKLKDLMIKLEGFERHPYRDTMSKTSVGIGRNMDDVPLSDDEIDLMFRNDRNRAISAVVHWLGEYTYEALSEVRKAAFISMAYNMGETRLRGFKDTKAKIKTAVDDNSWDAVCKAMLDSRWAKQVPARAEATIHMVLTNEWPSNTVA